MSASLPPGPGRQDQPPMGPAPSSEQADPPITIAYGSATKRLASPVPARENQPEVLAGEAGVSAAPGGPDNPLLSFLVPPSGPGHIGRLGPYEIVEVLGSGAVGVVFKGFERKLNRFVAIKALAPQLASSAAACRRFIREARHAAAVSHDNVIAIHAVDDEGPRPYLVMEYVSGQSLQSRLEQGGPLPPAEIVTIGLQLASGLAAAHARGLTHRDIKPANILLENVGQDFTPATAKAGWEACPTCRVKIADFGLAQEEGHLSRSQDLRLAGTPMYMAPEQAAGETVDQRTDLFSLGSVLYAMCTGQPPFRADSALGVLRKVCGEEPPAIAALHPSVPPWLVQLIARLQEKEPGRRIQSATAVVELFRYHQAHPQEAHLGGKRPPLPPKARRRRRLAVAALLVFLGGLALTEAAGWTRILPAATAFVRNEALLTLHIDDPTAHVSLAGQEGVTFQGVGSPEITLPAGQYLVRITRDDKPMQEELITLPRGRTETVRISVPPPPIKPFLVLGQAGTRARLFDTVAEALQAARRGDIVEIHGNGPFVTPPLQLTRTLTLRAARGFRPVLQLEARGDKPHEPLLRTNRPLVLEGLELQASGVEDPQGEHSMVLHTTGAALYACNCRFLVKHNGSCVMAPGVQHLDLRNCEFLRRPDASHNALFISETGVKSIVVENCIVAGGNQGLVIYPNQRTQNVAVTLRGNTMTSTLPILLVCEAKEPPAASDLAMPAVIFETADNILDGRGQILRFDQQFVVNDRAIDAAQAEELLTKMIRWQEQTNLYGESAKLLNLVARPSMRSVSSLKEWQQLWRLSAMHSLQKKVIYQGGDVAAKLAGGPDRILPADFRLSAFSPGKNAGAGGKDLGADIDLVGPGARYERWTKTADYRHWRERTKLTRDETSAR